MPRPCTSTSMRKRIEWRRNSPMPGLQLVFNPDFENVMVEYAASERGRKLLKIAGISEAQLDVQKMAMKYFANHVADVSVDPNANVGNSKCPNNFATEVMKGQSKRMAYWL